MKHNLKDKLLDLIVSGGACEFYCPGCPIRSIRPPHNLCSDADAYRKAIIIFVRKYGKEDLVEVLI